jgi:hypothetical protein
MSGHGLAADDTGAVYVITGNGDCDNAQNFGESFLKLDGTQGLKLVDWFTPDSYGDLNDNDADLGSTGPVLVPESNLIIGGGKDGIVYVMERNRLGKLLTGNSQIVQSFQAVEWGIFNLALWHRAEESMIYLQGRGEPVKAYRMRNGLFDPNPASQGAEVVGVIPFDGLAISADGGDQASAILWATTTRGGNVGQPWPGTLRAFDATNLATELWNSDMSGRDSLPSFAKFVSPTVVNGRVYVPTFSNQVVVYGLKSDGEELLQDINVVNAFGYQGGAVSPGELIIVQGNGIGPSTGVQYATDQSSQLPMDLADVRVLFDGQAVPLISASANQAIAVVPYSVLGQDHTQIQAQ